MLVYERDLDHREKRERASAWLQLLWRTHRGRLSFQVRNGFYVTVTQRLRPGVAPEVARRAVENFYAWRPVPIDRVVVDGAFALEERFHVSLWDALIVSAAQVGGCTHLLTEDLADGETYDGVRVVSPFTHEPGCLPG